MQYGFEKLNPDAYLTSDYLASMIIEGSKNPDGSTMDNTKKKLKQYYKRLGNLVGLPDINTLDKIDFAPPGFKVSPGWRVGHLREETFTKSGLLVPAGSEKTSEALPLIDVDSGNQFWAVASGAWKFIWPPTGKVVLAVRESQIIAEEEISNKSDSGQLPIMK